MIAPDLADEIRVAAAMLDRANDPKAIGILRELVKSARLAEARAIAVAATRAGDR